VLKTKINNRGYDHEYQTFAKNMHELFNMTIAAIKRHSENVIELTVKAPLAAKHFQPGQFYRLQNYETFAPRIDHTSLQIEPIALIATEADKQQGLLTFMIIENGASSKLCATFKVNDPVSLMGPTGVRGKISNEHETVLIIGTQISIPMLLSYGAALRESGNRVIYLAYLGSKNEVYHQDAIEKAADLVIWATRSPDRIDARRSQDYSAEGDALDILLTYAEGKLDPSKSHLEIPLTDVDRIFVMGNTDLLRRFQQARNNELKPFLIKNPSIQGSVYSTMQCMLKGVCAQCLQWQIDPETGKRTKAVFACSWPDQPLEIIDLDNLDERREQNRLQEHISNLWVDHLFSKFHIERV
jgi:NAD(P)H-flavin reductase